MKSLVGIKKSATFASQLGIAPYWTFSSAGLEHLPYKQRVGGSNPSTSTSRNLCIIARVCFFYVNIPFLHNLSLFSDIFNKLYRIRECLCLKSAIFANALFYCHSYCRVPASNGAFGVALIKQSVA